MQNTPVSIHRTNSIAVPQCASKLRWRAILAGVTATVAFQIVLMMLGAALGLAMFNPTTDGNAISSFGTGAAIIQGVSAVLALWGGGWIAGRFLRNAGPRSGRIHGFMVWCLSTVVAIGLLSTGAGWALGGLGNIVGSGLAMAGKPAMDGMADMAKKTADGNTSLFGSYTDEGLSNPAPGKTPADTIRGKRDLTYAITKLFTSDESATAVNKKRVVDLLVQNQGLAEPDASRMVEGWVASYQMVKADAEAAMQALEKKTREAAEQSAHVLSVLSLCYFAAFVLGAVAATFGWHSRSPMRRSASFQIGDGRWLTSPHIIHNPIKPNQPYDLINHPRCHRILRCLHAARRRIHRCLYHLHDRQNARQVRFTRGLRVRREDHQPQAVSFPWIHLV